MNTLYRFALLATLLQAQTLFAQRKQPTNQAADSPVQRCATDEAIQKRYLTDPAFRALMDERTREYQQAIVNGVPPLTQRNNLLTSPVTIPVVVHVVLPNPWIITDNDIQYFIDRMNLDFSGLNPDSTNCGTFCGIRGHSLIRFTLAKRDMNGNFTTGIERLVGTTTIGTGEPQAVKNAATSSGGLASWNVTNYYNLWVAVGAGGLLGIAPEIGTGTASNDGVCVDYRVFANSCFANPSFNLARTAVHEVGHNFGLYHTFSGGCGNGDFAQLTSPNCSLPAGLLAAIDNTPPQSASTSGCPTVGTANGCTPSVPKNFQNYMDYTNDACYSMFTTAQVQRMEWLLENCRPGYLTTLGGQYPAAMPALDAKAATIVAPGGSDFNTGTCTSLTYAVPACPGSFIPRLRVTNGGTATLTSITVTTTINGTNPQVQTIATNIVTGKSAVLTLNNQVAVQGANLLTITLSDPNGGADAIPADNTISTTFNIAAPTGLPYSQDFVSVTFPPPGITVVNNDGAITWVRNVNGNGNAGSAHMNLFDYNVQNQIDDMVMNVAGVNPGDTAILSFDVSYRPYEASPTSTFLDTLSVLYSPDCGITTTASAYKKWGATLGTVPASTTAYTTPTVWRRDTAYIRSTGNTLRVTIRCTNRYGNNLFLDNINLAKKTPHIYRFTGNGNWNVGANWSEGIIPPSTLPNGDMIMIDPLPGGECVLNVSMTVSSPGSIIVMAGKQLRIPGNLVIQ
jgi:Pregnancy-associated plasma protein-A